MVKILALLGLMFFALSATSQPLTESEVIGKWKVTEVRYYTDETATIDQSSVKNAMQAMQKAKFIFYPNKNFSFLGLKLRMLNKPWKIDEIDGTVTVRDEYTRNERRDLLMEFIAKKVADKTVFIMPDTYLILTVEKY